MLKNKKPETLINNISHILRNYSHERRLYILPRAHCYYVDSTLRQLESIQKDHYPFKIVRVLYLIKKLHDYLLKQQSLSLLPKINHFIFGLLTVWKGKPCALHDAAINKELQTIIDSEIVTEITTILQEVCSQTLIDAVIERSIALHEKDRYIGHTSVDACRIKSIGFKNIDELTLGLSSQLSEQVRLLYNADGLLFQRIPKIIQSCEEHGLTLLNLEKSLALVSKASNDVCMKELLIMGKVLVKGFE